MGLSDLQKTQHLLRRFAFGGSKRERVPYEKLDVNGTLNKLLDLTTRPPETSPLAYAFREKEDAEPGWWRFRNQWAEVLLTTSQPLRERLAIFWHDHFAVSAAKVEDGLMMLEYQQALRENPTGKFEDILRRIVTLPAFMEMLDVRLMSRTNPNENFGRELLELYTLGIGHYTETDIKEASRALTGWGYANFYYESPGTNSEKLMRMKTKGEVYAAFANYPALHDGTDKTILGKTDKFSGDKLLSYVATHPQTAAHLCGKLWAHFVYEDPEPALVGRLAKVFIEKQGSIEAVIRAMVAAPEFWSDKAINTRVKSPVDFTVSVSRAIGLGEQTKEWASRVKLGQPIPKELEEVSGGLNYQMSQLGMDLLVPPDVAGWNWGKGWVNPNSMAKRMQYTPPALYYENPQKKDEWLPHKPMKDFVAQMARVKDAGADAFVSEFLDILDAQFSTSTRAILKAHFESKNYRALFENENWIAWTLVEAMRIVCASPEYQIH